MKGKTLDETTAGRIKLAARDIFLSKGYDGATMQAIADLAGVNKAQLHYYFRSKDALFLLIFGEGFRGFFQANMGMLGDPTKSVREKLELWIDAEAALLSGVPQLPLFVITEINRNPGLIQGLMRELNIAQVSRHLTGLNGDPGLQGRGITIEELMTMVISLLVFPVMAAPMLQLLLDLKPERWAEVQARQVVLAKELLEKFLG
jgi:TetR/AcrR family transcriptional regulator